MIAGQQVLAEFADTGALLAAARQLRAEGAGGLELYSPYPLEGAAEALGLPPSRVPLVTLVSALTGAATGFGLQAYCNALDFPIIVGNRPALAAPSFVPITFELAVLFGALGAIFAFLVLNRLPMHYHPLDRIEGFRGATLNGFFLSAEVEGGPAAERLLERMRELGARQVARLEEAA